VRFLKQEGEKGTESGSDAESLKEIWEQFWKEEDGSERRKKNRASGKQRKDKDE